MITLEFTFDYAKITIQLTYNLIMIFIYYNTFKLCENITYLSLHAIKDINARKAHLRLRFRFNSTALKFYLKAKIQVNI